jgi:hypothetical protein
MENLYLILILIGAVLYIAPTIHAYRMKRRNRSAIFALNVFLGWTFIGWVACLVWASMPDKNQVS